MAQERKNGGTKTSSFGSPGRIGHDSSDFYSSRLYEGQIRGKKVPYIENEMPENVIDTIICSSSENMRELPDSSVHIMITSPPYNVGKDYDSNLTLEEYLYFLKKVWKETYRVLVPGGRVCINVANLGRKPYIPLASFIIEDMLDLGFLMRGELIWDKGTSASPSTAWGTWLSPKNAILRDIHEYILVFCKDTFSRDNPKNRESTITRDEFLEYTKSVWHFSAVSAKKIGHPAPFPIELPYRCIQLYTYSGEVVLDPFIGSGQTAIAAIKTGRHFVGYETNEEYVQLANKRIAEFTHNLKKPGLFEMEVS
ncbi:site-specific DNA-methyltransferase [bacterium]|nr:site-specific DNA-methyltransferase [bacterium]